MLFIAGQLVSETCTEDFVSEAHLEPYVNGSKTVPIMTYFMHSRLDPGIVCENLACVGPFGILKLDGLNVAFLGNDEMGDVLRQQGIHEGLTKDGIDLLITHAFPRSVLNGIAPAEFPRKLQDDPQQAHALGSDEVAACVTALAPRYVFSPSDDDFLERRPFLQPAHPHVTRFLALAHVANADKQKWLFAFRLKPGEAMPAGEGTTGNPFLMAMERRSAAAAAEGSLNQKRGRAEYGDEAESYSRWNMPAPVDQDRGRGGTGKRFVKACWFCLEEEGCEEQFIASVGEQSYLALAKGAILDQHVLILPIEHQPALVLCSAPIWAEMERYMVALRRMAASRGELVLFYERNIPHRYANPHCHIQSLPITKAAAERIPEMMRGWQVWPSKDAFPFARLRDEAKGCYFWFEVDGKFYYSDSENFDLEFGRVIYVQAMEMDLKRSYWRECVVSLEEETKITERFKDAFDSYDEVLNGPGAA